MAFDMTSLTNGPIVEFTLSGELDAKSSARFQQELEAAATGKPTTLVLRIRDLVYIASAGIRILIFAKQKMCAAVTVYVVAPREQVIDTLRRTGVHNAVVIVDEYPAATSVASEVGP
jgi:anti-anti-sigma factor